MIQSARSMWAARSAGVALSSRRREMRMSKCGEGEDLLLPVFEGVDVGEDYDLSAFEGAKAF